MPYDQSTRDENDARTGEEDGHVQSGLVLNLVSGAVHIDYITLGGKEIPDSDLA